MKWFLELFGTEDARADEMAVLTVLGVTVFLVLTVYSVMWRGEHFDGQNYGTGLGIVLGAAAISMGLKTRFERGEKA